MSQPLIYLSSPYSDPDPTIRIARFHLACKKASEMIFAGRFVFSPIAHSHAIAVGWGLPTDFAFWSDWNRRMLEGCDELNVLMIPGWKESTGVKAEIALARELGKPTYFVTLYGHLTAEGA